MWASILAVLATLAGVTLTFIFQTVAERRRQKVDLAFKTWEARRKAYLDLIENLVEFRRQHADRERARLRSADGVRPDDAEAVRAARAAARVKLYQAQLVAPAGSRVPSAWENAYELIRSFYDATDRPELERLSEAAKHAIETLVEVARSDLEIQGGDISMIDTPDDPRDDLDR